MSNSAIEVVYKKLKAENSKLISKNLKLQNDIFKLKNIKNEIKKELDGYKIFHRKNHSSNSSTIHRTTTLRRKEQTRQILNKINMELSKINYSFDQIYIIEKDTDSSDQVENFLIEYVDKRDSRYHTALKCLYYKDLCGISDSNYNKFRAGMALGSKLASLCSLKRIRKTYSMNLNIKQLSTGKYFNFLDFNELN